MTSDRPEPIDTATLRAAFVQAQAQIMNNGVYTPVVVIDQQLAVSLLDQIEAQAARITELERLATDRLLTIEAIAAQVTELLNTHQPTWTSDGARAKGKQPYACIRCGVSDGGWPCDSSGIADDMHRLLSQRGGSS